MITVHLIVTPYAPRDCYRTSMRLLLAVMFATSLAAQSRESIEVRVMELEVSVLDRAGHAVEGLTRDDFEVRFGRRPTPITNFFAVRNGTVVEERGTSRADERSIARQTSIPTTLAIFIDETHLRQGSRKRALEALQRYVKANVGPMVMATLIRYNKQVDVRTRPTDRPGYIVAELEKMESETFMGHELDREREMMIGEIDDILFSDAKNNTGGTGETAGESPDTIFYRLLKYAERRTGEVDRTLAALEKTIDLISGFGGRRVLLYVSDGLPQSPGADLFEYWDDAYRRSPNQLWRNDAAKLSSAQGMRFDRTAQFSRVAASAQRARVAMYSFDAAGVRGYEGRSAEFTQTKANINTTMLHANLRGGLQLIADETGGRYVANENNVDKVLSAMSEQFTTYYSIGVKPGGGDIRVTVKNRPELRVVAARRSPPRTRVDEVAQSVRTRLYTRVSENPLQAKLAVGTPALVDGQCVVPVRLDVAQPAQMTPEAIEVHFAMLNERNEESELRRVSIPFESGRAAHQMTLRVQPRKHVISIAVANPLSGEASYLQGEIDGRLCR